MSVIKDQERAFKPRHFSYTAPDTYHASYERARSLCLSCGFTVDDVVNLTPKFWDFHLNFAIIEDISALVIAQTHLNLGVGTIGAYAASRPDLRPLLDDLINFRTCASFLLTEFGHGLDVKNMETIATLLPDGGYDLHTPSTSAAKAMPPATPLARCPRIGLVFARLVTGSEDRGFKLFIVPLASADKMHQGVTTWMLPNRPGTTPLDHSLTTFDHVRLPSTALLGSCEKSADPKADLHHQLWRVSVGSISLSLCNIACLKIGSYIAGVYSKLRCVTKVDGNGDEAKEGLAPIISFSTQYRPVLRALVSAEVLEAFARNVTKQYSDAALETPVRRALAVVFKVTVVHYFRIVKELSERCGWRGFYTYNQLPSLLAYSAASVAEGDVLVISLRLAYELLTKRYALPAPSDPDNPLARHEVGLFSDLQAAFSSLGPEDFNVRCLPHCSRLILSIGQRMALETATAAGSVSPETLCCFQSICVAEDDASWYVENMSLSRKDIEDTETDAYQAVLPQMDAMLDRTGAAAYVTSPLVAGDDEWDETVQHCPRFNAALSVEDSFRNISVAEQR